MSEVDNGFEGFTEVEVLSSGEILTFHQEILNTIHPLLKVNQTSTVDRRIEELEMKLHNKNNELYVAHELQLSAEIQLEEELRAAAERLISAEQQHNESMKKLEVECRALLHAKKVVDIKNETLRQHISYKLRKLQDEIDSKTKNKKAM